MSVIYLFAYSWMWIGLLCFTQGGIYCLTIEVSQHKNIWFSYFYQKLGWQLGKYLDGYISVYRSAFTLFWYWIATNVDHFSNKKTSWSARIRLGSLSVSLHPGFVPKHVESVFLVNISSYYLIVLFPDSFTLPCSIQSHSIIRRPSKMEM